MTAPDRRAADSLLALVGGTPLVRLARSAPAAEVHAKLEYLNPGGSVKDRAALAMVLDAEESGALRPGGTIVEGTSGNTGLGLAQVAAARGYSSLFVLPDKTAVEKLDALRAYGAEIVLTPSALPREHPDHVIAYATRLAKEIDGGWLADQYGNPANPDVHRRTTGPEIWEATGGRITHLVATIGTGGTITGTGQYLHEVSGGRVQVVGADPVTSAYGGGDGSPFAIEAAGHYIHPQTATDVFPDVYRRDVIDRFLTIGDRESILTARALARTEGLLVGGSSGTAAAAALRVAREAGPDAVVVAILPDSGRAYLSKYHSDTWVRRQGFLDDDRAGTLVSLVSPVVTVPVGTTVGTARSAAGVVGAAGAAGGAGRALRPVPARRGRGAGAARGVRPARLAGCGGAGALVAAGRDRVRGDGGRGAGTAGSRRRGGPPGARRPARGRGHGRRAPRTAGLIVPGGHAP